MRLNTALYQVNKRLTVVVVVVVLDSCFSRYPIVVLCYDGVYTFRLNHDYGLDASTTRQS